MLTRFVFISTIHGCFVMCQGVARRSASFSRLNAPVSIHSETASYQEDSPAINEILEVIAPRQITLRLVL